MVPNSNGGYRMYIEESWGDVNCPVKIKIFWTVFFKQEAKNSFEQTAAPITQKQFPKFLFSWSTEGKSLIDHSSHLSFLKNRPISRTSLARIASICLIWSSGQAINPSSKYQVWFNKLGTELLILSSRITIRIPADQPAEHPIKFEGLHCY